MTLERGVQDLRDVAAVAGADLLVGHSWGGAVVVRGGQTLGASAIVAIDPMIVQVADDWYAEFIDELEETFTYQGDARDERIRVDYSDWHPSDVDGKVHAVHSMTTAPIAGLRDQNQSGWDLRGDIATYPKPLLMVMAGPDGSIVPVPVMEELVAHHAPDVQIITFDDLGHNVHRADFDRFAKAMDEFLDSLR
jgi:pimeloyl-ACP methyl ester carboxylesterase